MNEDRSRRYFSKDNTNRSALQRAAEDSLTRNKVKHVLDFSKKKSENSIYAEESKVPTQNSYNNRGLSPSMSKPPLANINFNIPNPKIVNPYAESPRLAINNKPPSGLVSKAGLPPLQSKPGFGAIPSGRNNFGFADQQRNNSFGRNSPARRW